MGNSPRCLNLAEGLIPVVVQWIRASATPASMCAAAGVCGAALQGHPQLDVPSLRLPRDNAECAMCKYVISEVKTLLDKSVVVERATDKALQVCLQLPQDIATACKDSVEQYGPVLEELVEELDPDPTCQTLGACPAALAARAQPPALPADLAAALAQLAAGLGQARCAALGGAAGGARVEAALLRLEGPNDPTCDYCKMAVLEAHSLLSNPAVQASLVNYTKALCDSFPNEAGTCKLYVDTYAVLVFSLLTQHLIPEPLCATLGMCPPPPAPAAEQQQGAQGSLAQRVHGALTEGWQQWRVAMSLRAPLPLKAAN